MSHNTGDRAQGRWARREPSADPVGPTDDPTGLDVQIELRKFATEFMLWVTPTGELAAASYNTLGYEDDERAGHHIAEHIHPDDLPKIFDIIERARRTAGFDETVQARARHVDGSWRVFDTRVFDASLRSNLKGSVVRVRDVTEEHNSRISDSSSDRFLSLAEMIPQGILLADARGWVAYQNSAAEQILNQSGEQLTGHGWENAVLDADRPLVDEAMRETLQTGLASEVTFRVVTGLFPRWAHAKFVAVSGPSGTTGWIATIEDITDRRRLESELSHQATHDPLTDLPNRTLLEDRLRQAVGRLRRDSTSITLFFIDLDGFKAVNDTLGHQVGDVVLVEIGRRLRHLIRDVDTVARLGGDEFVAMCESLPEHEAADVRARIEASFDVPMLIEGEPVRLGASVGCSRTDDPLIDVVELLAMADQSMYREKHRRQGRSAG
jgi:diguanylate cyclase (GGDEF)-like protein/PAS domain S-box-containing protein